MIKCSKCGKQIIFKTKYCPECGNVLEYDDKKQKHNVLKKCPSCGEKLSAFDVVCPACGYELIKKGDVVKNLSSKLDSIEKKSNFFGFDLSFGNTKNRVRTIRNCVVPNNKEDIVELMITACSNINPENYKLIEYKTKEKEVSDAWIAKYEEASQKAKILFPSDNTFVKIEETYAEKMRQVKKAKMQIVYLIIIWMVILVILFLLVGYMSYKEAQNGIV